jgi:hypothetical protein
MTRKDYQEVATLLGTTLYYASSRDQIEGMTEVFTKGLERSNPNFKAHLFERAVREQAAKVRDEVGLLKPL